MCKIFTPLCIALITLATSILPAYAEYEYENYSEAQLNKALSDAEHQVSVCTDSISKANYQIGIYQGNIEAGTAEPDYVRDKIRWMEEERTRLYQCLVKQRKIISQIQGELNKRMKNYANNSDERKKWLDIRKRADKAMASTIAQRSRLAEIMKQVRGLDSNHQR